VTFAAGSGPISFQDRLCLLTAKRYGYICVTNDKNLRKQCVTDGVPILWGLQLLARLHENGGMPSAVAIEIARQIHKNNPRHITVDIIERFIRIIKLQKN